MRQKKQMVTNACMDVEQEERVFTGDKNANLSSHYGNLGTGFSKKLEIDMSHDSTISFFNAALFTIAKKCKPT